MRRIVIVDSLYVTFVVSIVIIAGFVLGDVVSEPIQISIGASSQQIHDSQNMTFLSKNCGVMIFSIIGTFILSLCMLNYLEHGKEFDEHRKHKNI